MTPQEETLIAFDSMATAIAKFEIWVTIPELKAFYMGRMERAGLGPKSLAAFKQFIAAVEEENTP